MGQHLKRYAFLVFIAACLAALIYGLRQHLSSHGQRQVPMPPLVVGEKLKLARWQMLQDYTALAVSKHAVGVTSQVPGQVLSHHIKSGSFVKKGTLLVVLDDSIDQQNLHKYCAQARLAMIDLERKLAVFGAGGISRSELDAAKTALRVADANAQAARAAIAYKHIRAPFSGWLGVRRIDVGQYTAPGAVMVTLQSLNPIFVDFWVPEAQRDKLRVGETAQLDGFKGLATVINISKRVDAASKNFKVRARYDNSLREMRPGQFVMAHVQTHEDTQAIIVPATAINYSLYGDTVYVLKPMPKKQPQAPQFYQVKSVAVTLGQSRMGQVHVLKGLSAGDVIIVAGQTKVRVGAPARMTTKNPLQKMQRTKLREA